MLANGLQCGGYTVIVVVDWVGADDQSHDWTFEKLYASRFLVWEAEARVGYGDVILRRLQISLRGQWLPLFTRINGSSNFESKSGLSCMPILIYL